MTPAYGKYALVLVKNKTYDKVDPGDVIAFKADGLGGNTALHRVVSVTPEGFITKGDANKQADRQMVNDLAFLGRTVWHTNLTTKLIPVLQTPKGIFFMAALPMAWVILVIRLIRLCAAAAVSKNAH
jgi:signal peptidase I